MRLVRKVCQSAFFNAQSCILGFELFPHLAYMFLSTKCSCSISIAARKRIFKPSLGGTFCGICESCLCFGMWMTKLELLSRRRAENGEKGGKGVRKAGRFRSVLSASPPLPIQGREKLELGGGYRYGERSKSSSRSRSSSSSLSFGPFPFSSSLVFPLSPHLQNIFPFPLLPPPPCCWLARLEKCSNDARQESIL